MSDKPKKGAVDCVATGQQQAPRPRPANGPTPAPVSSVRRVKWTIDVYLNYYESMVTRAVELLEEGECDEAENVLQRLIGRLMKGVQQFERIPSLARILKSWKADAERRLYIVRSEPSNGPTPSTSSRAQETYCNTVEILRHVYEGVVKASQDAVRDGQWESADTSLRDGIRFFQGDSAQEIGNMTSRDLLRSWRRNLEIRRLLVASRNDRVDRASLLAFADAVSEAHLPPYSSAMGNAEPRSDP